MADFGKIEFDIKYVKFYFIWLFKGVFTVTCSKFCNEKTRINLFSLFWFAECWFGLVTSTYSCSQSQYSELVTHSHSQREFSDCVIRCYPDFPFCWAWISSWLLDSLTGTFQICLSKFIFCLSFEQYHITPSLSRLNI